MKNIFILILLVASSSAYANDELFKAVDEGNLREVNRIIEIDPKLNINALKTFEGNVLGVAAEKGYLAIVNRLLKIPGIDVNLCNSFKEPALIRAITQNKIDVVRRLLKTPGIVIDPATCRDSHDNSPNNRNFMSGDALGIAAEGGHLDIVNELLKVPGIDVNVCNFFTPPALFRAVAANRPAVVKRLLQVQAVKVEVKECAQSYPASFGTEFRHRVLLENAVRANNVRTLRYLLGIHPELIQTASKIDGFIILALFASQTEGEMFKAVMSYPEFKNLADPKILFDAVIYAQTDPYGKSAFNLNKFYRYFNLDNISDSHFIFALSTVVSNGDIETIRMLAPLRPHLLNKVLDGKNSWFNLDNLTLLDYNEQLIAEGSETPPCVTGTFPPEQPRCAPTRSELIAVKNELQKLGAEALGIRAFAYAAANNNISEMKRIYALAPQTGLKIIGTDGSGGSHYALAPVEAATVNQSIDALKYLMSIPEFSQNRKEIKRGLFLAIDKNLPLSAAQLLTYKGLNVNEKISEFYDETFLEYAKKLNRTEIVSLLETYKP